MSLTPFGREWISEPWCSYVETKIAKTRLSLREIAGGSDSFVFSLFGEHINRFLEWLTQSLKEPSPGLLSSPDEIPRQKVNILDALDRLALFMRFIESAQAPHLPHPLIDHVQGLFAQIENSALLLLRPQNDQEYETRGMPNDLRTHLEVIVRLAGHPDWDPEEFLEGLSSLHNIYVISYPKYLGDVFLFFPLLGHELAHVVYHARSLEKKLALRQVSTLPRGQQKLALRWGMELFCDLFGYHLYGESYIFALWLFLQRYPEAFSYPPYNTYLATYTAPEHDGLGETLKRILADAPPSAMTDAKDKELLLKRLKMHFQSVGIAVSTADSRRDLYRHYPSPGRRLRELVSLVPADASSVPTGHEFAVWRTDFIAHYAAFGDKFPDAEYEAALNAAKALAHTLYNSVFSTSPTPPESLSDSATITDLVDRLEQWIPPCEVIDSLASVPRPADWCQIILAGWVHFIAISRRATDKRGQEWPLHWLDFVFDAFDMNALYAEFADLRRERPGERVEGLPMQEGDK